jgi:hypothetical protein
MNRFRKPQINAAFAKSCRLHQETFGNIWVIHFSPSRQKTSAVMHRIKKCHKSSHKRVDRSNSGAYYMPSTLNKKSAQKQKTYL